MKKILLNMILLSSAILFTACSSKISHISQDSSKVKNIVLKHNNIGEIDFSNIKENNSLIKVAYKLNGKNTILYPIIASAINQTKKEVEKRGYRYFQIVAPVQISNLLGFPINNISDLSNFLNPSFSMPRHELNFLETSKTLLDNQNSQNVVDLPFSIFGTTEFNFIVRLVKEYYGNALLKIDSNRYKLQNKSINSIFSASDENELERLVDIYHFINPNIFKLLEDDEKKLIKKISKSNKECFYLEKSPFESFKNYAIIKELKSSIKQKRYINIIYDSDKEYIFENIKPIKIVFNEGNWYLGSITQNEKLNNGFKWIRINFIKKVMIQKNNFITDIDAINFIKTFQNMFTTYKKENQKVILNVSKEVARFFISKKHFKTQQIIEKKKMVHY